MALNRRRPLYSTGHLAGPQATGAGINPFRGTIHNSLDTLDIGFPSAVGTSVRVGYLNTESDALSADITFSHTVLHLLLQSRKEKQQMYISRFPLGKQAFFQENVKKA